MLKIFPFTTKIRFSLLASVSLSLTIIFAAALLSGCQKTAKANFSLVDGSQTLASKLQVPIEGPDQAFTAQNHFGAIDGTNADGSSLAAYTPLFVEEFSFYPTSAIKRSGLRMVILCRDLKFAGVHRTALPDYEHDVLYLDVERGNSSLEYQRKVIHHEFFHIIDWMDDGKVYSDDLWAALNPVGFKYGSGGKAAQTDPAESLFDSSLRGFVTKYAMAGVEEDKAETFANMMVNYQIVEQRAQTDPVLKSKFLRMKDLLYKFDSSFDRIFWAAISNRPSLSHR